MGSLYNQPAPGVPPEKLPKTMAQPADLQTNPSDIDAAAWRGADEPGALPADPALAAWLGTSGSLTRRLRRLCGADFALEVVTEGHEPASPEDQALLGTREPSLFVRRVRLCAGRQSLVHACTFVPSLTLRRHPRLAELGASPLWEALADREGVRRTGFQFARVGGGPRDGGRLPETPDVDAGLWGRRSLFLIDEDPLLVYEFFRPALADFGLPE